MREADGPVRVTAAADQAAVRGAHLGLVLRHLRAHGPRTRARLAGELGLSKAVATSLLGELEERGLVRRGAPERGTVGRPGATVELDGPRVCGVGAEINVDHVATAAVDLAGNVLVEDRRGLDSRRLGPDGVLDLLSGMLRHALDEVAGRGTIAAGITVGVAGLVDTTHDVITVAPNLGWRELPAAARLRDRLGPEAPPIRLDNEATLAAVAEADSADPDRRDMLVIYGEVGVGGGIVADGRPIRGRHGWAAEFGHILVDPQGRPCGCGRVGCWETVIGLHALLDAATEPDDVLRDPSLTLEERLDEIVARANLGDARTLRALETVGAGLGAGAATLVNVLDPEVLVLSGYFAPLEPFLRESVEKRLDADVLAPRVGGTHVDFSSLGPIAAVRGGASVSLEPVLTDPTLVPRRAGAETGGTR